MDKIKINSSSNLQGISNSLSNLNGNIEKIAIKAGIISLAYLFNF